MKILYSILFVSLIACSQRESNYSAASLNLTDDIVSQIEDTAQNSLFLFKDSAGDQGTVL